MKTIGEALHTTRDGGIEKLPDGDQSSGGDALQSIAPQPERPINARSSDDNRVVVDLIGGGNLPARVLEAAADLSFR